jgi:integrase
LPVPEGLIEPVKPYVSAQVWVMIQLQLLAGARPEDVVRLRPVDLQRDGDVWKAELAEHKTAYREHRRTLYFGPKAQALLRSFLMGRPDDMFLFSPDDAETARRGAQSASRRTPLSCGNRPGLRRAETPKRRPADRYTVASYRRAIQRACDQAFPPPDELNRQRIVGKKGKRWESPLEWTKRLGADRTLARNEWQRRHRWHPHQLRHNAATEIRREFGVEMARIMLGVRSIPMAELYGERDQAQALKVAAAIG